MVLSPRAVELPGAPAAASRSLWWGAAQRSSTCPTAPAHMYTRVAARASPACSSRDARSSHRLDHSSADPY